MTEGYFSCASLVFMENYKHRKIIIYLKINSYACKISWRYSFADIFMVKTLKNDYKVPQLASFAFLLWNRNCWLCNIAGDLISRVDLRDASASKNCFSIPFSGAWVAATGQTGSAINDFHKLDAPDQFLWRVSDILKGLGCKIGAWQIIL